jgi:hypothetical protein
MCPLTEVLQKNLNQNIKKQQKVLRGCSGLKANLYNWKPAKFSE